MGKILAIKTSDLFPDGVKSGFFKIRKEGILQIINERSVLLERSLLEEDENYQQIIPQIILKVRDHIFIHRITQKSSENRLVDMYPIFLGGHVDEGDLSIEDAANREFDEEIDYRGRILSKEFQGLIKLHDEKVNRVHTGLVWIYEGDSMLWKHRDEDLVDGKFVSIKDMDKLKAKMNYWSRLYLPELRKVILNEKFNT